MTHAAILLCLLLAPANCVEGACPPTAHSGRWAQRSPMPIENSEFGAGVLNGLMYAAGGYLEENHNFFGIYNPRTGAWQQGPDLPFGTHHPGVVATSGKVYVLGGEHAEDKVQIYDPVARTWSMGRAIPTPREAMAAVVFDGKIHLIGGAADIQSGVGIEIHDVYDPQKDTWQQRAPLPVPVEHTVGGVLNGRIFIAGGRSMFGNLKRLQIYNPTTNTWTQGPELQTRRSGFGLAVFEKRIYVFGGEDLRTRAVTPTVERYDPVTQQWEYVADFRTRCMEIPQQHSADLSMCSAAEKPLPAAKAQTSFSASTFQMRRCSRKISPPLPSLRHLSGLNGKILQTTKSSSTFR